MSKFFDENVISKTQPKKNLDMDFVKESFDGVYNLFNEMSTKLDERFKKIEEYGNQTSRSFSLTQEEIFQLNAYLKQARDELEAIKKKNRIRDLLMVGHFLVLAAVVAVVVLT